MATIENKKTKQKLLIVGIVAAVFAVILLYSVIIAIFRAGKVGVEVKIAPFHAKVIANGVEIKNNGKIYLEPGNYHVEASCDHFDSFSGDFTISADQPYIGAVLVANDAEGEEFISGHQAQFAAAEGVVGKSLNAAGVVIQKKYPIIKHLPINNRFYSIGYSFDDPIKSEGLKINIKTDYEYLDVAIARLKNFEDVSLIDLDINFNITNAFANPKSSSSSNPETFIKDSFSSNGMTYISGQNLSDKYYLAVYSAYNKNTKLLNGKYLVLIEKSGESWKLVSTPQPILTKANTPGVPDDILNTANSFTGQ